MRKSKELKLDLGCGKGASPPGFTRVDQVEYKGVKVVHDLTEPWPWDDNSVDEVCSRHLINYLTAEQRVFFVNELHRVLKVGGQAQLITPHWASNRAYGDITQVWPPVAEEWFFHLNKKWREEHAYWTVGYTCDFDFTCGYAMHPLVAVRNQEYQRDAIMFWKEAAQEMSATLTKL